MTQESAAIERDETIASRVLSATNSQRRDQRQSRSQRQRDCQLVALGIVMAGNHRDVRPVDFMDSSISGTVERFQKGDATSRMELEVWLRDHLGVGLADAEKMFEAVLRTVRENSRREKASVLLHRLSRLCDGPMESEDAFIERLKDEVSKL